MGKRGRDGWLKPKAVRLLNRLIKSTSGSDYCQKQKRCFERYIDHREQLNWLQAVLLIQNGDLG